MFQRNEEGGGVKVTTIDQEIIMLWQEIAKLQEVQKAIFGVVSELSNTHDKLEHFFHACMRSNDALAEAIKGLKESQEES